MIVQCLGFGTVWWNRFATDGRTGEYSRRRSAVFNTTGFQVGSRYLRNWVIKGFVRLNCNTFPVSSTSADLSGRLFTSSGIYQYRDTNRLQLDHPVGGQCKPDFVLYAFQSRMHGMINFRGRWRSNNVRLISFSARNGLQEFLLLMPIGGRIATTLGIWEVVCQKSTMMWSCKITLSSQYSQRAVLG